MNPSDLISSIREDEFHLDADGKPKEDFRTLLDKIQRMAETLSKNLYGEDYHFIFELIQNAEDNTYPAGISPSLRFELIENDPTNTKDAKGCLCIFNNEIGFNDANVKALCDFNNSTKKDKSSGFIGEKGIGFKSVFSVTESPHIFSNGFQFKFLQNDPIATVGYIVPYWLNHVPQIVKSNSSYNTAILLPLGTDKYDYIKKQLTDFEPRTVLFLKKLQRLEIVVPKIELLVERKHDHNLVTLSRTINKSKDLKNFWVETLSVDVPESIREEKREGVSNRDLTVAFPLDGVTGDERLYSYLPTEVIHGLPFYINGDFLLNPSREHILSNRPWNKWLIECIGSLVANGIINMLNEESTRYKSYGFIPLEANLNPALKFLKQAVQETQKILSESPCIIVDDSSLEKPERSRSISPGLRKLLKESRPTYFNNKDLIHKEISSFSKQLESINVGIISADHLKNIFADSQWLLSHSPEWFVRAYQYLIDKLPKSIDIRELQIIPSSTGLACKASGIFLPPDIKEKSLMDGVPEKFRVGVEFVDTALFEALESSKQSFQLLDKLRIDTFSVTSFLVEVLLPNVMASTDPISVEELKRVITYVFKHWEILSENEQSIDFGKIPLLLEGGEIAIIADLGDRELVVPKEWDAESGWQILFDSEAEHERFAILDSFYSSLKRKTVEEYFEKVEATTFPDCQEVTLRRNEESNFVSQSFLDYAQKEFLNNFKISTTNEKLLKTWILPSAIRNKTKLQGKFRTSLLSWLTRIVKDRPRELKYARGLYYYYLSKTWCLDSAIYFTLQGTKWIKTSKGYRRPREVFVSDPTLHQMFSSNLAFLEDDLTDELIDFLGINRDASEGTLLNYLRGLSDTKNPSKKTIIALYEYLTAYCEDFEDIFKEEPLIYVSQNGGKWLKSTQVIWEDGSVAAGDTFGWLSKDYPQKQRTFFVEVLGVKEEIDDHAYIDAWLELQSSDSNEDDVQSFLTKAIPKIANALTSISREDSAEFCENALVWTRDKCWESPSNVFVADDNRLSRMFGNALYFIWIPENRTHASLASFYESLEIEYLSQAAEFSVLTPENEFLDQDRTLLTSYTLELICYALANRGNSESSDFDRCFDNGVLASLFNSKEISIHPLTVIASVDGHDKELRQASAFFDQPSNCFYLNDTADREDVLDDAADVITRLLWGRSFKQHRDTIRLLLAVPTDARFKKLRDRENWHLPQEHRMKLKEIEQASPIAESTSEPMPPTSQPKATAPEPNTSDTATPAPNPPSISYGSENTSPIKQESSGLASSRNPGSRASLTGTPAASDTTRDSSQTYSGAHYRNKTRSGSSKSSGITLGINKIRRSRMRSYVSSGLPEEQSSESAAKDRTAQGELGEKLVMDDLIKKGYKVQKMPTGNKGYDLEASRNENAEMVFVEVKSDLWEWDEKGVSLSPAQYQHASVNRENFYLAVIENLGSSQRTIHYIQDPVSAITEYAFDSQWRGQAVKLPSSDPRELQPVKSILETLLEMIDCEACRQLIHYCDENNYPFPDIGMEIVNEHGEVIVDSIELGWGEEFIAVVLTEEDKACVNIAGEHWSIYAATEFDEICHQLDSCFHDAQC